MTAPELDKMQHGFETDFELSADEFAQTKNWIAVDIGVTASNRKALEAVVAAGHRREQSFSYAQEEAACKHDPLLQARRKHRP